MASNPKTNKFKLTTIITAIIIIIAAISATAIYLNAQTDQNTTNPSLALTIISTDGQQKTLTQNDFQTLNAYKATGGLKTSGEILSGIGEYTGVPVTELLDLVGGITSDQTLNVTASDGYSMTYTYDQVQGQGFNTYDSTTGNTATATQPMKMVLTYYLNNTALQTDTGPLRLMVLGSEGLLVDGRVCVRMVTKLEVLPANSPPTTQTPNASPSPTVTPSETTQPSPTPSTSPSSWGITVNGSSAVTMTQTTFETQASQNPATYTASSTSWTGTPLYQIVTWAQNNGAINSEGLTDGYVVKIIASDGFTAAFNDTQIEGNSELLVANAANGSALTGNYYPLSIRGIGLSGKEKVQGIAEIKILPIQHLNLTIVGADGSEVTLFSKDLAKMQSITFDGGSKTGCGIVNVGTYTGVKLIDLCNLVGVTSNNTIAVKASDDYTVTYTYDQVANGTGFTTFDDSGETATATQPVYLILAYWFNRETIDSDNGPLKVMVVGAEGLLTPGNVAAKMIVEINIT